MLGISRVDERLVASDGGLSTMELVSTIIHVSPNFEFILMIVLPLH
jgi:hypothetical protein